MSILSKLNKLLRGKKITSFSYQTSENVQINDVDENDNPLDNFINSLTQEQQNMDVKELDDNLIYQYIIAVQDFQKLAIPNPTHLVEKSFHLIGNMLVRNNTDQLSIDIIFRGTKHEVNQEAFSINFFNVSLTSSTVHQNPVIEVDDESNISHQPKKKFENLNIQKDNVIQLFHILKNSLPDTIQGITLAIITSSFLSIMDYISDINSQTTEILMDNLIYKDEPSGISYKGVIIRNEIYKLSSNKRSKP